MLAMHSNAGSFGVPKTLQAQRTDRNNMLAKTQHKILRSFPSPRFAGLNRENAILGSLTALTGALVLGVSALLGGALVKNIQKRQQYKAYVQTCETPPAELSVAAQCVREGSSESNDLIRAHAVGQLGNLALPLESSERMFMMLQAMRDGDFSIYQSALGQVDVYLSAVVSSGEVLTPEQQKLQELRAQAPGLYQTQHRETYYIWIGKVMVPQYRTVTRTHRHDYSPQYVQLETELRQMLSQQP